MFGTTLLIVGSEALLVERAIATRVASARREAAGAELNEVPAGALDGGRLAEISGGSLFSPASIAVITDLADLPTSLTGAVTELAVHPPAELCLVLAHPGGVKGKGLLDTLRAAHVERVDAAPIKPYELPGFVAGEARRRHLLLDGSAPQALVDAVGTDLRALQAAVNQLAADYEGEQVTGAMVGRYFAGRAETTSFAVADDVLAGRRSAALSQLRWALQTGAAPVLITAALASSLRGLGRYLDLRSARLSDPDLARQVGVPPWKLKTLSRQAGQWSPTRVADAIQAVATADRQVKGAATDPAFALEALILHLTEPAGRVRP